MTPADRTKAKSALTFDPTGPLSEAFVLLDNSSGSGPPSLLYTDPVEIIEAQTPDDVGAAIAKIESGVARGLHAAGFMAYELGYALEPKLKDLMPTERPVPLIWFGLYDAPDVMEEAEVEGWLATNTLSASHEFSDVSLAWDEAAYLKRFDKVLELIRAGDIYQLNLTFKSRFKLSGSPLTFYRDLRAKQRVAYGGIVDTGQVTVLSASPELFVSRTGRTIETRPMKGTSARAGAFEADQERRRVLSVDEKQRAENLMIVDLMRNDIGRISELGSVEVTDLFSVETYKTLHQMTSGICAHLKENLPLEEFLRALFPPGSITGAPKIRAMELISELESEARGVYCGMIGRISPDDTVQFNVAIRTPIVRRNGEGEMGIGSGVVYDSEGEKEYAECLLKMKFLTDAPKAAFQLIETLLYRRTDGFWLLERHLGRLHASAEYFGYRYDEAAVREALDVAVDGAQSDALRVRLTLGEDGKVNVTTSEITLPTPASVMRFVVSDTRLDPQDLFLFHKTTRRELYDRQWAHYAKTDGADEVVYLNTDGFLTEGSRTNIFLQVEGKLLTPALHFGLLPGTFRAELMAAGKAEEASLRLEDLRRAEQVFLGNSVRGLVRADLIEKTAG